MSSGRRTTRTPPPGEPLSIAAPPLQPLADQAVLFLRRLALTQRDTLDVARRRAGVVARLVWQLVSAAR